MRFSFVPLAASTLALATTVACSSTDHDNNTIDDSGLDSGDSASDSTFADVGTDARADVVDATSDAPADTSADTGLDADDGAPAPVTVVVRNEFAVEQGVTVVFQDSTGAVLTTLTTDATGSASSVVPTGGQITALLGTVDDSQITTVTQVVAGDVITLVDATAKDGFDASVTITSLPSSPPAGATQFVVDDGTNCDAYVEGTVTFAIMGDCESDNHAPLFVSARDVDGTAVGYTFLKTFTIPPGVGDADAGADAGTIDVALTAPWMTTTTTDTVSSTNAVSGDGVRCYSAEIVDGVPFVENQYFNISATSPTTSQAQFKHHPGFADTIEDGVELGTFSGPGYTFQALVESAAPSTGDSTSSFDLSTLLPTVTVPTLDSTNVARPVVAWTSAGALGNAGGFAHLRWTSSTDAGGTTHGSWTIVVPASATSVTAPSLPASAAAWLPTSSSTIDPFPDVLFLDGSLLTSYDALRNGPLYLELVGTTSSTAAPALPIGATLRLTGFTQDST